MILDIKIHEKGFGTNQLFKDFYLEVNEKKRFGFIGRNGAGKTTLFKLITGEDKDLDGIIKLRNNLSIITTKQEHDLDSQLSVLNYILHDLPNYEKWRNLMSEFEHNTAPSEKEIEEFSETIMKFSEAGYYNIEGIIEEDLRRLQFSDEKIHGLIRELSGGQKRLIEVVKVMNSGAELILMDEPTNHMDFVAKEWFLNWLKECTQAVIIITHDRDVLKLVDEVLELKDGACKRFKGNYDYYLKINAQKTGNEVGDYELVQKTIENLKEDVIKFKRLKEKSRNPPTIRNFKRREMLAREELAKLELIEKPSFWIDQESKENMKSGAIENYDKYKAKNISVKTKASSDDSHREIIKVSKLSLGFATPLFENINFSLRLGDRMELRGRNGAGKSTLINAILATLGEVEMKSKVYAGLIETDRHIKVGVYEQEVGNEFMEFTLKEAIEEIHFRRDLSVGTEKVRALLGDYLFDPIRDENLKMKFLSGGQKARFQLMKMLLEEPNLLILDEPTNHLDLPSIEELENALKRFSGSILYVSHDSYFRNKLGGTIVEV